MSKFENIHSYACCVFTNHPNAWISYTLTMCTRIGAFFGLVKSVLNDVFPQLYDIWINNHSKESKPL